MVISISLVCTLFILIDLVAIYKNKQWWTFWVYSTILAIVYVLTLFIAAGIKIPSPAIPLKKIISTIYEL